MGQYGENRNHRRYRETALESITSFSCENNFVTANFLVDIKMHKVDFVLGLIDSISCKDYFIETDEK